VGQKYSIQPSKNPATGQYPKVVKFVDAKGDMILTDAERNSGEIFIPEDFTLVFEDGFEFNLKDPYQRAQWEAIQYCPMIAKSIDARDGNGNLVLSSRTGTRYSATELYIELPGYETNKKVNRRQLIHDAETYIFSDPGGADNRLKMVKLLGRDMRNSLDADVKDFLLSIAAKDPEKIIKLYTGDDLNLRLLFTDAVEKRVIRSHNNVYVYADGIPLGANIDSVIIWMRDPRNMKLLDLIKKDTYGDEVEVTNPMVLEKMAAREAEKAERLKEKANR